MVMWYLGARGVSAMTHNSVSISIIVRLTEDEYRQNTQKNH